MNKSELRNDNGALLTVPQAAQLLNLGVAKVRELSEEAGAVRRFGRAYRINRQILLAYIENAYGE